MKKFIAAIAVTSFMALAACANVSPIQSITTEVCKEGTSVGDKLLEQQTKHPDYNIHIENIVTGEVVATLLGGSGVKADKVVVLGAVIDGKPSGGVLLLAVDGACVVGSKGVDRDVAISQGLLPAQAS